MMAMVGATLGMSTNPDTTASAVLPSARPSRAEPTVTTVATNERNSSVTRMTAARMPTTSPTGMGRSRHRSTTGPRILASTPAASNGSTACSRRFRCASDRSAALSV